MLIWLWRDWDADPDCRERPEDWLRVFVIELFRELKKVNPGVTGLELSPGVVALEP